VRGCKIFTFGLLALLAAAGQAADKPAAAGKPRTVQFSGYRWLVKQSDQRVGPGPNYFSGREENVWVDKEGNLHLKITQRDGKWWAAEVYSQKDFGHGTYVFQVTGRPDNLDQNAVLGLYTWDNTTFMTDANSEIDIEFARWGDPAQKILQYSVQPTRGPDAAQGQTYRERWFEEEPLITTGASTHTFTWLRDRVSFASYDGRRSSSLPKPLARWTFSGNQPARRAKDEGVSRPVVFPRPGRNTKAQMNLWLNDSNGDGAGDAPSDGKEIEIVIEKFEFKAGAGK
jgi:hypothetical protein